MNRWRRWALGGVLVLAVVLIWIAGLAWMLSRHPALEPYAPQTWTGRAPAEGSVRISFLGVSTVLIDDGQTALLTDGFFSRPDKMQTIFGRIAPDLAAIDLGMARSGLDRIGSRLAAIIPVHSHYDHAMDAPEVARRTGALLVGSASTAQIGRGWGLPESRIRVAQLGQPMRFGAFTMTLLPSRHAPTGFTGGEITEPLKPPARATDYKEGQSYAVLVQHGDRSLLINGSAGFVPGALAGVKAEVVLLGIGALGPRGIDYMNGYWHEVVAAVGARRVIPIHWDDFWLPPGQPMKPMPAPLDRFDDSMNFLMDRGRREAVDVRLPLQWQPMDPWADLAGPKS